MVCDLWSGSRKASPVVRGSHRADQELLSLLLLFPRASHLKLLENSLTSMLESHVVFGARPWALSPPLPLRLCSCPFLSLMCSPHPGFPMAPSPIFLRAPPKCLLIRAPFLVSDPPYLAPVPSRDVRPWGVAGAVRVESLDPGRGSAPGGHPATTCSTNRCSLRGFAT